MHARAIDTDLTDLLKKARELRGLSQSDLARRCGLQPSAVSHFETGRRAPSIANLRVLADALDVSADFLLGRQAHKKPLANGPLVERLTAALGDLSTHDAETLVIIAEQLAARAQ